MKKIFVQTSGLEDWQKLLAQPEKHWRKGYSARSLACCWEEAGGIPKDVLAVITRAPSLNELETLIAIPEHKVPLPGGGRSSQNDCWVLARTPNDLVSIAVEGKVSEPFGPTVGEWSKDASSGKTARLAYLCSQLGLDMGLSDGIRYQLLHRTASAVIEAKRFHAKQAVMVVHSFSQTDEWFNDYQAFASLFGANAKINEIVSVGSPHNIDLHLAWVSGAEQYLKM